MANNLKYELTEEFISLGKKTLYRIKALKSFSNVKKGDLGGYIMSEDNLSHGGACWVYNNAKVYDDAWVFGNAHVSDKAVVYGYALVSGKAQVYGNARIFGDAYVSGDVKIYGNAEVFGKVKIYGGAWAVSPFYVCLSKHRISSCSYSDLKIGCQVHSIKKWKKHGEKIGKENGYSDYEIELYKEAVKLAEKHIELAKKESQNGRTREMDA